MHAALRIDVDTWRGTRLGVPRLLDTLARFGTRATFFVCVGPDNMGRHLFRLLKPAFLRKMLRTRAPSLYGWDILRCGLWGPGPDIGVRGAPILRRIAAEGHEVGLHAWDHHRWQTMDLDDPEAVAAEIARGVAGFRAVFGRDPDCAAAPAWRANAAVLAARRRFPGFRYHSDVRGTDCFLPLLPPGPDGPPEGGAPPDAADDAVPQIPVTLPTYDESVGAGGVTDANHNERLLDRFRPDGLNVLCIHAEAEGGAKADLFADFLAKARQRGIGFVPLGEVLPPRGRLPRAGVRMRALPGREGKMGFQAP